MTDISKPPEAVWRPIQDLPPEAAQWGQPHYRSLVEQWRAMRQRLIDARADRWMLDTWLAERRRLFAIETGQIEDLYLLRRGVTEQLITEGFEGVRGAHSATAIGDDTLKGLLADQEAALEMVFAAVKDDQPLSHHAVKSWHQLLTRHQSGAAGRDLDGRRMEVPLLKGEYKLRPKQPAEAGRRGARVLPTGAGAERDGPVVHPARGAPGAAPSRPRSRRRGCTTHSCAPTPSRTATGGCPGC